MSNDFIIDEWDLSKVPAKQLVEPITMVEQSPKEEAQPSKIQKNHWYHCQREADGLRAWLLSNDIEGSIVDSLLANDTRPRFELFEDNSFLLILRGINLNEGAEPDDMLSIRMLWHNDTLISTRKIPSRSINQVRQLLMNKKGPKNLPALMLAIIEALNHNVGLYLTEVEDELFKIEEEGDTNNELNQIHKRLLKIRRFMKPQRYAHDDFLDVSHSAMENVELKIRNALDTVTRITESIDFYIEQIQLIKAEIEQEQTKLMNRNSYLFTVIAAIFLPVSFLTGLLGINVGGIPGTDNPFAFLIFCFGLAGTLILEFILLRKLKFM